MGLESKREEDSIMSIKNNCFKHVKNKPDFICEHGQTHIPDEYSIQCTESVIYSNVTGVSTRGAKKNMK